MSRVDDAQLDERIGAGAESGPAACAPCRPIHHVRREVGERQDRAGLGHAVAREDVDALLERAARASGSGSAEPPMTPSTARLALRRRGLAEHHGRMVGTQCEKVTFSRAIRPSSMSGT